jgi:exopolyphosphatase/pppGpp-phosphohydrolase
MSDAAREEFLAVMQHWEEEPLHVIHVAHLAIQLFEGLVPLHCLGPQDAIVLEAAAHLHDIGWKTAESGKEHHKESARLIRKHPWQHFSAPDVRVMALVARYHRKALPCPEHEDFMQLEPAERARVEMLAAHLRIADALDRSHDQRVVRVTPQILADRIVMAVDATAPLERELAAGNKKADLARVVFRRDVIFHIQELPMQAE